MVNLNNSMAYLFCIISDASHCLFFTMLCRDPFFTPPTMPSSPSYYTITSSNFLQLLVFTFILFSSCNTSFVYTRKRRRMLIRLMKAVDMTSPRIYNSDCDGLPNQYLETKYFTEMCCEMMMYAGYLCLLIQDQDIM